jgi:hypothetical protein
MLIRFAICIALLGLAGCSYQIDPQSPQPPAPFMAYADRVPGKWLLVIDASAVTARPAIAEPRCDRFDYSMDFSKTFAQMAASTFEKIADDIRVADRPPSRAEVSSGGYTGVIVLRVTEFHPRMKVEGVLDPTADADAEIVGTIVVTKDDRHLADANETGKGTGTHDAGVICGGAADAMSDASNLALQDLIRKFAERFANSHDVRYSVPGFTPQ